LIQKWLFEKHNGQYTGIPAKWIEYIYENYGIYTMLNHTFGRYGLTINGVWVLNTEYPSTQLLIASKSYG
jgi:hypothetical protein